MRVCLCLLLAGCIVEPAPDGDPDVVDAATPAPDGPRLEPEPDVAEGASPLEATDPMLLLGLVIAFPELVTWLLTR